MCCRSQPSTQGRKQIARKEEQKIFVSIHCVFRLQKQITYETPIRGYHNILQKSHGWGRHARASPPVYKTGSKENFCDAQPPHAATFTQRKEELQAPVAEFFRLEADSPYGKLQKRLGKALLSEHIFFPALLVSVSVEFCSAAPQHTTSYWIF